MTIDKIFTNIGELGPQQIKYCLIIGLSSLHNSWYMIQYTFVGQNVRFQCHLPNRTILQSECPPEGIGICKALAFETQSMSTIVSEWNLVCENTWLSPLTMTLFMFGVMCGAVVLGTLSDMVGRKKTFLCSLLISLILNAMSSQVESFVTYAFLKFFCGFFICGIILSSFVLQNELIGASWRGFIGVLNQAFFAVGIMAYSLTAYFIRDWRHLTEVTSLLGIFLVLFVFYLPESPHWLLSKGQVRAATNVLKVIAQKNGVEWSEKFLLDRKEMPQKAKETSGGISDLFLHPYLLTITLIQIYSWFVNGTCYYGLTLAASTSNQNPEEKYMATALSGAIELPAYAITLVTLSYFGRKWNIIIFMLVGSMALFGICLFGHMPGLTGNLILLAKLCISSSFAVIYVHSSEVFATSLRNSGMGIVAVSARFGGAISPYFARIGDIYPNSQFLLFAILTLTSGWLNTKLPETKGLSLPERVSDMLTRSQAQNSPTKRVVDSREGYSRIYNVNQGAVI